jgi:transcriptional regulator with XRE-family HTH domain
MAARRRIRQAEIVTHFAQRLRALRLARGMTQRDLARSAHITFSYVSRLEAGGASPGIDLLERLAQALGVHVVELLPTPAMPEADTYRDQVRELFDTILERAGRDTLSMLRLLLERMAESASVNQ